MHFLLNEVINLGLTGLLSIIVIGGIAAGSYYYRDGIKDAFANTQKSEAEQELDLEKKEYDFERQQKSDDAYDNFFSFISDNSKNDPKDSPKEVKVNDTHLSAELKAKTDYDLTNGQITYNGLPVQTTGLLQSLSSDTVNLKGRRFH